MELVLQYTRHAFLQYVYKREGQFLFVVLLEWFELALCCLPWSQSTVTEIAECIAIFFVSGLWAPKERIQCGVQNGGLRPPLPVHLHRHCHEQNGSKSAAPTWRFGWQERLLETGGLKRYKRNWALPENRGNAPGMVTTAIDSFINLDQDL